MVVFIIFILILLCGSSAEAARLHPESYYQNQWCADHNGKVEHILPDITRVDCLTVTHAIEIDFADKHYEAVGQAMFYSEMTGLLPGVVLIMEDTERDYKYLIRLLIAVQNIDGFRVWIIK